MEHSRCKESSKAQFAIDYPESKQTTRAIHDGISASDYQRVQQWIAAGFPKAPDTAFTAGTARDAARLIVEALEADRAKR